MKAPHHEWLARWFQARHLSADGIADSRRAFTTHPARLLVLDDILRPDVASGLGRFLEHQAPLRLQCGLFSRGRVDPDQWRAAPEEDRFFRYEVLGEGSPQGGVTPDVFAFLGFRQMIQDPRLGDFLAESTGLGLGPLASQDVHAMRQGHLLKPHTDRDDGRLLAFVFYLSADWRKAYGGALAISDRSGKVSQLTARCNRLILFDLRAHERHWVTAVTEHATGRPRLSIGGWFSE